VSRFGPGAAHLHDLLHYAIDRGLRIFDFTIGDERYKRDWCDTELKLYDFIAAATWRGALVALPMLGALRLKRWIKQTPVLWNAFSGARAFIGSLAQRFRG
jgi:CelD/BcsL family acetyltransferase involved in cellulose biosynthesis